jgi:hypothetical protein
MTAAALSTTHRRETVSSNVMVQSGVERSRFRVPVAAICAVWFSRSVQLVRKHSDLVCYGFFTNFAIGPVDVEAAFSVDFTPRRRFKGSGTIYASFVAE